MRRLTPLLAAAGLAALLPACGNERQRAPGTPGAVPPVGKHTVALPRHGVTFTGPANWRFVEPRLPLIAAVVSGQVAVNLWRYERVEPLPESESELQRARRALLKAARARDRSLKVRSAREVELRGVPGVEVVAEERIGLARRTVRSTHLYAHGGELVVDAYAPPGEFARVDRQTFRPLLRSLRVERPARRDRR